MRSSSCDNPVGEWRTESPSATEQLAASLAQQLLPDTAILLQGALGAGKTTFVRGFARALGISEPIRSPSFALIYEYTIRRPETLKGLPLFHIDLYRLQNPNEVATLGLDELMERESIVLVEWPERLEAMPYPLNPQNLWQIRFTVLPDETRHIAWFRLEP
ncbi:MAG: tRNA (adenosine(37)-N6)-threonylcarbamoyltransferase complex ATPase subunit type 1 TsaE [Armatimonadota bacterium]